MLLGAHALKSWSATQAAWFCPRAKRNFTVSSKHLGRALAISYDLRALAFPSPPRCGRHFGTIRALTPLKMS